MKLALLATIFDLVLLGGVWLLTGAFWRKRAGLAAGLRASAGSGLFAAAALAGAWGMARLVSQLAGWGGPIDWVHAPTSLDAYPYLAALAALFAAFMFLLHGALRSSAAHPHVRGVIGDAPLAPWAAGLCAATGLTVVTVYLEGYKRWMAAGLPIDLAVLAPLGAWLSTLWYLSTALPAEAGKDAEALAIAAAAPVVGSDLEALLRTTGVLGEPVFSTPARDGVHAAPGTEIDVAWRLAGGVGHPPVDLEPLANQAHPGGSASLIGDLPQAVEQPVCAALILRTILNGERVLYVGDDAPELRVQVRQALARSEGWPVGPLIGGGLELAHTLQEQQTPAAVFVTAEELDTAVVPLLAGVTGHRFLETLACVVLGHPDLHRPIAATHLYFTLRRLSLLLRGAPWPAIIATGDGTAATRRFIEELAGRTVLLIRGGLSASSGVRVYRGHLPGGGRREGGARRALAGLAAEGSRVAVEDPDGQFAEMELRSSAPEIALTPRPSFHREVSLALIDESWIARLFRIGNLIPPRPHSRPHVSVWWVPETPLSRFLLRPNMLKTLQERNELATPRVLLGRRNRWLINAHMDAALLEAAHAESDLRRTFGDAAVTERLAAGDLQLGSMVARVEPGTAEIVRSRTLKASSDRVLRKERRTTVTRDVIRVEDEESGTLLTTVDRRILPTRFYPRRVFAMGARRFTVSPDAYSDGLPRERLCVKPSSDQDSLTAPLLDISPTFLEHTTEPVRMDRGDFTIAVGACAIAVSETVRGRVSLDATGTTITFTPVNTREPYETRAATVFFQGARSTRALVHLARLLNGLLVAHLATAQEDVEVVAAPDGFAGIARPALIFVDRHIGGMGVAEALEPDVVHELLRWARALLASCPNMSCLDGCSICTPPEVLKAGPDKQGVLQMLGASQARRG